MIRKYDASRRRKAAENTRGDILQAALKLEADIQNLLAVLRFANDPDERSRFLGRGNTLAQILVQPGDCPVSLLTLMASQDNLDRAVDLLSSNRYEAVMRDGLLAFKQTGRLSEFETRLRRYALRWLSSLIYKDPLGIGVFLGYQALKVNEIGNLRWIIQGIHLGLPAGEIKANLELAT